MHAVTQLLDRLAAADESQFLVAWTEPMLTGRSGCVCCEIGRVMSS